MRDYELTLIINPELNDESFDTTLDNISRFITDRGGVITDTERKGKKRLAYPIKHRIEGYYVMLKMQIEPSLGNELEASLLISEDVIRHLLIRVGS
ncbi:30S ribosomal protein S6 [Chloroflexota bacterium]